MYCPHTGLEAGRLNSGCKASMVRWEPSSESVPSHVRKTKALCSLFSDGTDPTPKASTEGSTSQRPPLPNSIIYFNVWLLGRHKHSLEVKQALEVLWWVLQELEVKQVRAFSIGSVWFGKDGSMPWKALITLLSYHHCPSSCDPLRVLWSMGMNFISLYH